MMSDINSGLGWSAAQWEKVNNAVTEAFGKASVVDAFLKWRYGPLPDSQEYVRNEKFAAKGATVKVEDDTTQKLFNLTVNVELSSEQVADEALSTALLAFRRAANTLAQVEDDVVFNGFRKDAAKDARNKKPEDLETETKVAKDKRKDAVKGLKEAKDRLAIAQAAHDETRKMLELATIADANVGAAQDAHQEKTNELQDRATTVQEAVKKLQDAVIVVQDAETKERTTRTALVAVTHPDTSPGLAEVDRSKTTVVALKAQGEDVGELLVTAVVNAIANLEDASHPGPFACVLGSNVFEEAHRPVEKSLVLPADRITPLLNGPLLRSGQMDKDTGIVVSLAGNDIDIVVATPPRAQFLQVTKEAKYLFRVYEKVALRIKDPATVQPLALV